MSYTKEDVPGTILAGVEGQLSRLLVESLPPR